MTIEHQYTYGQKEQYLGPPGLVTRYHHVEPVALEPALRVDKGREC